MIEKKCPYCKNQFIQKWSRVQTHCSRECFEMARKKKPATCLMCGVVFIKKYPHSKYCSRKCSDKRIALKEKVCPNCGKNFLPKRQMSQKYCNARCAFDAKINKKYCVVCNKDITGKKGKFFCSHQCAAIPKRNFININCKSCGKLFSAKKCLVVSGRKKFCSKTCFNNDLSARKYPQHNHNLSRLNYKVRRLYVTELLRDKAIERDGRMCTICGSTERLEVHHIKTLSEILKKYDGFENPLSAVLQDEEIYNINNLKTMCHKCHKKTDTYGAYSWIKSSKSPV